VKTTRWDVLAMGAIAVDDLIYVDQYPQPNTKVPVAEKMRQGGGLAGTAVVAAARLGARTAYCGVLGLDELSRYTVQQLQNENVDCSMIQYKKDAGPMHSVIIVVRNTGNRSILFYTAAFTPPDPSTITRELITGCRILFLDSYCIDAGLQAIDIAHDHGIPVLADIEPSPNPCFNHFVKQIDHLIIGIEIGNRLTGKTDPGEIISSLTHDGRACCAVTAGEDGCWFSEYGGPIVHFPAYKVETMDTTGCGDVFHGAYAARIASGDNVSDAIKIATAASGIKATQPGGRSGIPGLLEVMEFIREKEGR